jgi:hypothetical protein
VANDALILGLAGIVTSGVLGPWVATNFARERQSQEFKHTLISGDRGELRELVDNAAVALNEASLARGEAAAGLMTHGRWIGERDPLTVQKMTKAGRELDMLQDRLAIRLRRTHSVTEAFHETHMAFYAAYKP